MTLDELWALAMAFAISVCRLDAEAAAVACELLSVACRESELSCLSQGGTAKQHPPCYLRFCTAQSGLSQEVVQRYMSCQQNIPKYTFRTVATAWAMDCAVACSGATVLNHDFAQLQDFM